MPGTEFFIYKKGSSAFFNVKSISIATEQVPNRETNELSNVSSIEIEMGK